LAGGKSRAICPHHASQPSLPPLYFLIDATGLAVSLLAAEDKSVAAAKAQKYPPLPEHVERRAVTIRSDGTKMAGDLYLPKGLKSEDKLPAVVFIAGTGARRRAALHGWGRCL
jgi:acetyl esterase/lipase